MNADFAHAVRTLIPERLRRRWTNDKIESKQYSCSTFMLYLGIEGDIDLQHHTIVLAHDYAENLREIESGDAPPVAPSIYVQNPARPIPRWRQRAIARSTCWCRWAICMAASTGLPSAASIGR